MEMIYGRYRFECRFETAAILPRYKGSTFRGVFGHALKRVVCALTDEECSNCLLKTNCVYAIVFETRHAVQLPEGVRLASAPPPFVIEPPEDQNNLYSPDDPFDFHLLLFGAINNNLPYFIYAFDQMGKLGVGKRIDGQRGTFRLDRVLFGDQVIYTRQKGRIEMAEPPGPLSLNMVKEPSALVSRVRVVFETPMRTKARNQLAENLPFVVLVRTLLRRASSLLACYGDGDPDLDYKGLICSAETIGTAENRLSWSDWSRYSNRQQQKMQMGGIIGSVVYSGDLTPFLPLLDFCGAVHLGKQTTFGLGRYHYEPLHNETKTI